MRLPRTSSGGPRRRGWRGNLRATLRHVRWRGRAVRLDGTLLCPRDRRCIMRPHGMLLRLRRWRCAIRLRLRRWRKAVRLRGTLLRPADRRRIVRLRHTLLRPSGRRRIMRPRGMLLRSRQRRRAVRPAGLVRQPRGRRRTVRPLGTLLRGRLLRGTLPRPAHRRLAAGRQVTLIFLHCRRIIIQPYQPVLRPRTEQSRIDCRDPAAHEVPAVHQGSAFVLRRPPRPLALEVPHADVVQPGRETLPQAFKAQISVLVMIEE